MKSEFIHLKTISDMLKLFGLGNNIQHPLVAVIDFSKVDEQIDNEMKISSDYYSLMFKNYPSNKMKYGRKVIDFQDGSLICMAPNQVLEIDNRSGSIRKPDGLGIIFPSRFNQDNFIK